MNFRVVLVIIANGIAMPVGYLTMKCFLQNYKYHISFSPLHFLAVGVLSLLPTVGVTLYHSMKSEYANPVDAIRYE